MGFLQSTAQGAAGASTGWGQMAAGSSALGSIISGIGGMEQGSYNSKIAGMNATAELMAGQANESALKGRTTRLVAEQKAAQAANGIEVGSKSAEAVRASTQDVGDLDAAMIHYNAMRAAYGDQLEGQYAKRQGQAALMRGIGGAGSSLLGSASSLSAKAFAFRQSGATGSSY